MTDRVAVGFWPGVATESPDHWYIVWLPEDPYSSADREPTEAEVREAVRVINKYFDPNWKHAQASTQNPDSAKEGGDA